MNPDEILELVKEGAIEPEQIEDFENLDDELKELVQSGDLEVDEALDLA